jgi:formylglycine-generating enzyme required for sulfatase activity
MKIKKSLLLSTLIGFVFAPAPFSWAKQQVLQDLTYSQRLSTKLVDINYRLSLEAGQTAEVTFTFSHDNGSTFPVECRSVTGDVGKGMTSGNKSAVWDAGVDWPLKFTEQGRIKATCTIKGEALPLLANPKPIPFEVVSVPLETSEIVNSPAWSLNKWIDEAMEHGDEMISQRPKGYKVAKYEVTNSQWNEVVKWSVSRGYDLKQVSYKVGEGNLPRTNVAIKEVIKWLNALSEKHGLTPMYYLDPFEPRWDQNGDGKFTLGNDSMFGGEVEGDLDYQWDPDFDWSLIPNGKENLTGGWIEFDPNYNGIWDEGEPFYDRNRNGIFDNGDSLFGGNEPGDHDYSWDSNFDWSLIPNGKMHLQGSSVQFDPNFNGVLDKGEPFYDRNRNGKFEPWEFFDFNNNRKVDDGLTEVYRTGDISSIEKHLGGFSLRLHKKLSGGGFTLPKSDWAFSETHFLAMGGRENSEWGEYWEDWNSESPYQGPKQGLIFKDEWPWGAESPDKMSNIDEYAITPFGKFSMPQEVGLTKANGYGIHDMIGNVREYIEHWHKGTPPGFFYGEPLVLKELMVSGGSVSNSFEKVQNWDSNSGQPSVEIVPSQVMAPFLDDWSPDQGNKINPPSADGNPDVGFRPIRWTF